MILLMKILSKFASLLFGLIACCAAAPLKNTLDFYLSDPSKHLGKSINLSVSHIDPLPYRGQLDNLVFFRVYTSGENGHKSIPLAVDTKKSKEFADYYGTKISTKESDMHRLVGKFRYVDPSMAQTMHTSGLWFVGIMQGAYFIDATTEGQLDTVFNWYPEKTTAVNSGKSIIRVSAKETTEEEAKRRAELLLSDKEKASGKKAQIVKQEITPVRDKKICTIEFFLE
jgi:hypothetical protein